MPEQLELGREVEARELVAAGPDAAALEQVVRQEAERRGERLRGDPPVEVERTRLLRGRGERDDREDRDGRESDGVLSWWNPGPDLANYGAGEKRCTPIARGGIISFVDAR